jgi:hypothetical protein
VAGVNPKQGLAILLVITHEDVRCQLGARDRQHLADIDRALLEYAGDDLDA